MAIASIVATRRDDLLIAVQPALKDRPKLKCRYAAEQLQFFQKSLF